MIIREMTPADFDLFYPVFADVVDAQETYAFEPGMSFDEAYNLWCVTPLKTYVLEEQGTILGSYYLKPNAMGPSRHICNCGYMVSPQSRGKGVARRLCEHSQALALELGFTAMQFNAVVSTNEVAINLWKKLGFVIIGTIPNAYLHKRLGYVDSHIMYKALAGESSSSCG
ncbi:GNAT family N-acetyltransferase [Aestuariirhabdus sp. Z084]|uniref:GNAT family N-acetyltransferase n=1 Tax=Aestuariirhabdus haliotis TaxID=2918751 RepID=UPI00201B43AE|nr:GNAT family N-acetyltransferase [Aestuariirhabdus haliotis]MCL6417352.1 GNAT family N-acetyltransferase [Aestuariirhabdus haliotis]MCL6421297.1 GNAT family N-acetyltransferase [Aestuariirhabdus haliotis]